MFIMRLIYMSHVQSNESSVTKRTLTFNSRIQIIVNNNTVISNNCIHFKSCSMYKVLTKVSFLSTHFVFSNIPESDCLLDKAS